MASKKKHSEFDTETDPVETDPVETDTAETEPGTEGPGPTTDHGPRTTDSVVDPRDAKIKELEAKLAAAESEAARIADQPRPSDVRPGQVWNQELKRGIPIGRTAEELPRFQITAPVRGYNDVKAGVKFRDSVGDTDDADLANWFRDSLKYAVLDRRA